MHDIRTLVTLSILATALAGASPAGVPEMAATSLEAGGSMVAWIREGSTDWQVVHFDGGFAPARIALSSTDKPSTGAADTLVSIAIDHDAADRVFIIWQTRQDLSADTSCRLWAQSFWPDGSTIWGPKVVACNVRSEPASLAPDGQGGVTVAFGVDEAFSLALDAAEIRHVNPDGYVIWARQFAAERAQFYRPQLVPTEDGGVIVAFETRLVNDGPNGVRHILAQRLTSEGTSVWHNEGELVAVAATPFDDHSPVLVPDGAGATVVFVSTITTGQYAGNRNIAAQRINADGTLAWGSAGSPVWVSATTAQEDHPVVVPDGEGGIVVAFEARAAADGASDIWAQRLNAASEAQWGYGGMPEPIAASTADERSPHLARSRDGHTVLAYTVGAPGERQVCANEITLAGTMAWPEPARILSPGSPQLVHLRSGRDHGAELIVARSPLNGLQEFEQWSLDELGRIAGQTDVPTAAEYTGPLPKPFRVTSAPNPFNAMTVFTFWSPGDDKFEIHIHNVLGQRVRVLTNHTSAAGWQRLTWDGRNESGAELASGTYLYTLTSANGSRGTGLVGRISGRVTLAR